MVFPGLPERLNGWERILLRVAGTIIDVDECRFFGRPNSGAMEAGASNFMDDAAIDSGVRWACPPEVADLSGRSDLPRVLGVSAAAAIRGLGRRLSRLVGYHHHIGLNNLGEQGREPLQHQDDRAVPPGDLCTRHCGFGRRVAATTAQACRSRGRDHGVARRFTCATRRKRGGVVLGCRPHGGVSERCSRRVGDVHQSAGSARTTGGGKQQVSRRCGRSDRLHMGRTTSSDC